MKKLNSLKHITIIFICIQLFSCVDTQNKDKTTSSESDKNTNEKSDNIQRSTNSVKSDSLNNSNKDLLKVDSSTKMDNNLDKTDTNKINSHPEFYDEYSETIRYYKSYINKAYDNKTHSQYFGTSKQKVLDSLIIKYEENKN